jgi:hypothetical protein
MNPATLAMQLLEEAVDELMKIESHVCASSLTLAKVALPDGRDAILRMELTTDEWDVEDAVIWKPKRT